MASGDTIKHFPAGRFIHLTGHCLVGRGHESLQHSSPILQIDRWAKLLGLAFPPLRDGHRLTTVTLAGLDSSAALGLAFVRHGEPGLTLF